MSDQSDAKRLAVLAYHKIGSPPEGGWDTWHYIPEATFIKQLEFIQQSDWRVLDLASFQDALDSPEQQPDRSLLLTFDDGHKSMHDVALPILRRFKFPAAVFVPTAFIGQQSTFDGGDEPEEPMCDWDDLRKLEACGVSIQSHGVTHNWFSLLDETQQKYELVASKRVIEERLNRPLECFAFPYSDAGDNSEAMRSLLCEAGYTAAFLCGGGSNVNALPVRDRFRISRLPMYRDTDLEWQLERGTVHLS